MKRGRGRKEGREGERKRPGKVKQGKQVHMWQKERTEEETTAKFRNNSSDGKTFAF